MKKSILIGVAGGSGSGKTSMAKNIIREFNPDDVAIIELDSYYFDLRHIPLDMRRRHNFDHPQSYDFDLLKTHIKTLLNGGTVQMPVYDYISHTRSDKSITFSGHKIIVLEGIMVLFEPELRDMMDIKVFIQTTPDIRFIRRLKRDIQKRGRSPQAVIDQYMQTVRPMHEQFIEPSKKYADIIIPEGGHNKVAIDLMTTKINALLKQLKQLKQ